MGGLFEELKRRNVFRVGVAYIVVGWLLIEVGNEIFATFGTPDWVPKAFFVLVLLGFPIALLLAWAFEMEPEGAEQEEQASAVATGFRGRKIDMLVVGVLVTALGYFVWERQLLVDEAEGPQPATKRTSIAVLPFVNMSSDPEQEFFSDGMTEEILNALARIDGLRVIARTSAFAYKGQNLDLREVGRSLGVANIVEGSVRKAGNRLRITAQLIDTTDGGHIWSEVYDRELTDVFAIQDEIATSIARALTLSLGLGQGQTLVEDRIDDMAVYETYLKARRLIRARGSDNLLRAVSLLRTVTKNEPDYAPGWAALSLAYHLAPLYLAEIDGARLDRVALQYLSEQTGRRAVSLNPHLATARHVLANALRWRHQWVAAEDEYLEAMRLDPESVEIIEDYAQFLQWVGKIGESVPLAEKGLELEPSSAFPYLRYLQTLGITRHPDQVVETSLRVLKTYPKVFWINPTLLDAFLELGQLENALAALKNETNVSVRGPWTAMAVEVLTAALNGEGLGGFAGMEQVFAFNLEIVYLIGGDELVLKELERRSLQIPANHLLATIENAAFMDSVRSHERYKQLVTQLGLVDYWRARGWPDYCHPTSDYDFECGVFE